MLTVIPIAVDLKHVADIIELSQAQDVVEATNGDQRFTAFDSNGTPGTYNVIMFSIYIKIAIFTAKILFRFFIIVSFNVKIFFGVFRSITIKLKL